MLTPNGLEIKRLPDVIQDILQRQQSEVDPNIGEDDSDWLYQNTIIYSYIASRIWELAQAVNDNFNVDKAEGRNLDDLGAIVGVTRNPYSFTTGTQYFVGEVNTVIASFDLLENPLTKARFVVTGDLTLTESNVRKGWISVVVTEVATYTLSVNGRNYTITGEEGDTETDILLALKSAIDIDLNKEASAEVIENQLILETLDDSDISVTYTANLNLDKLRAVGTVRAVEPGPVAAPPTSVTRMLTPVDGLIETYNPDALTTGRFRETDEEYRDRIKVEQTISGAATLSAIEANLRNVLGVSYAVVEENRTMDIDSEGRQPKSIEAVVEGGLDDDIALTLWNVKGAGIETVGAVTIVIIDEENQPQEVHFSRPTQANIAVRITYTLYDEEEFPEGGEDIMRTVVRDYINAQGLGKDAIPGRYFGDIYKSVSGVGALVIEIQRIETPGEIPNPVAWQTTPINIINREFCLTSLADITIVQDV